MELYIAREAALGNQRTLFPLLSDGQRPVVALCSSKARGSIACLVDKIGVDRSAFRNDHLLTISKDSPEPCSDIGAYHVVNFCKDADEQFGNIKKVVPRDENALPIVLDLEWLNDGPSARSQRKCADLEETRSMLRALANLVQEYYGKRPMMFAHEGGVKKLLSGGFNDYPLWLQDWTKDGGKNEDGPTLSGANPWTVWQYAGNTKFAGIKNTDVNAFFGSPEQYAAFKKSGNNVALEAASK